MKLYVRLMRFILPHSRVLWLAVVFMLSAAVFDSVSLTLLVPLGDSVLGQKKIVFNRELPAGLTRIIERINNVPPLDMLNIMLVVIIVGFILKGVFFFFRTYLLNKLSQLVIRDIRNALYRKIQYFSLDYFSQSVTGHLVSHITYDVEVLKGALSVGLTDMVYQLGLLVVLAAMVLYINWQWALTVLIVFPLVAVPIVRVGQMIKKISGRAQEQMGELNRKLFETIAGVRIVKAFSREEAEIKHVAEFTHAYYRTNMKMQRRALILGPFTEFIGAIGGAVVLYYGGREVIQQSISFGIFMLFLGALLSLIRPARRLSEIHTINQQALAAAQRIFAVLDTPVKVEEDPQAAVLSPFEQEIVFHNVSFAYQDTPVITNISLTIRKGEIVALVGPSGVGKTTLANLLPRFYDPTAGRITMDGVDIRRVTFTSLRGQIGIVTQDLFLFNDTVRANIAYGRPDAGDEDIIRAAQVAEAHEFITELPEGYQTKIGDMGTKLSGGQKQRLSIARAILNNPPILILDEATSHLDAESSKLVQEALDHVLSNRTAVVIAHRLGTVRKASRIIVLDRGGIVEEGTHEELLERNGVYKRLADLEFES